MELSMNLSISCAIILKLNAPIGCGMPNVLTAQCVIDLLCNYLIDKIRRTLARSCLTMQMFLRCIFDECQPNVELN